MDKQPKSQKSRQTGNKNLNIFVGSLNKATTEPQILSYFQKFGRIDNVNLIIDWVTNQSKRCAIVFCADRATFRAILKKKVHMIKGKKVRITKADKAKKGTKIIFTKRIFVSKIPGGVSKADVRAHFAKFGKMVKFQLSSKFCFSTRKTMLYAIIEYRRESEAKLALDSRDEHVFNGVRVSCSPYKNEKCAMKFVGDAEPRETLNEAKNGNGNKGKRSNKQKRSKMSKSEVGGKLAGGGEEASGGLVDDAEISQRLYDRLQEGCDGAEGLDPRLVKQFMRMMEEKNREAESERRGQKGKRGPGQHGRRVDDEEADFKYVKVSSLANKEDKNGLKIDRNQEKKNEGKVEIFEEKAKGEAKGGLKEEEGGSGEHQEKVNKASTTSASLKNLESTDSGIGQNPNSGDGEQPWDTMGTPDTQNSQFLGPQSKIPTTENQYFGFNPSSLPMTNYHYQDTAKATELPMETRIGFLGPQNTQNQQFFKQPKTAEKFNFWTNYNPGYGYGAQFGQNQPNQGFGAETDSGWNELNNQISGCYKPQGYSSYASGYSESVGYEVYNSPGYHHQQHGLQSPQAFVSDWDQLDQAFEVSQPLETTDFGPKIPKKFMNQLEPKPPKIDKTAFSKPINRVKELYADLDHLDLEVSSQESQSSGGNSPGLKKRKIKRARPKVCLGLSKPGMDESEDDRMLRKAFLC